MQLDQYVYTFGQYLRQRFNEKVHKLSIHAGFTCPNRDGTLGIGGCTFCNNASFNSEVKTNKNISEQLSSAKENVRAKKYLAYFQAYTNTYAEVSALRQMYEEALRSNNIVGLCVGTRPDCLPESVLSLLSSYQQQGYEVWLELGLQTANDVTLQRINRGHNFAAYVDAVKRIQQYKLNICTHLIVGLPGETAQESFDTLAKVIDLGCEGLKLHPLMIVKGSQMAKQWKNGLLSILTADEYAEIAAEMIRHTPKEIVFHRVSATAKWPTLLAPEWCNNRWPVINQIVKHLNEKGGQGSGLT
ncbi:TIGR01212 family radical SAM protein [Zooshikella ganghwensis]|uniref:TIGR01212 family radical SAM protein n=1 Tax=Zooshikella ganghwensis TaxID=202772 RepID=A0A4P9VSF9_9GAMM|nr:TIGR01212 family radical SAM protein [Zooshikella ganghwensis]RDH46553.1 TIGR01212 family radical SAM protein [Zooshikella ganghwensis]